MTQRPASRGEPVLTRRELEVLRLWTDGLSTKEIAAALDVTVRTAETHRANIRRKLNVHSMPELMRYALRRKLIRP